MTYSIATSTLITPGSNQHRDGARSVSTGEKLVVKLPHQWRRGVPSLCKVRCNYIMSSIMQAKP